ncbi:MAG: hypothetical protein WDA71_04825 [Actinomycetota bacterium]
MSCATRLTVTGLCLSAALLVAGVAFIPARVSLNAGSLRCGTALHPDRRNSEIGPYICPDVARQQRNEALAVSALFVGVALVPLALRRVIDRSVVARALLSTLFIVLWILGIPLAVYCLAGAVAR